MNLTVFITLEQKNKPNNFVYIQVTLTLKNI